METLLIVYDKVGKTSRPRNNLTYDECVVLVEEILKKAAEEDLGEEDIREELTNIGLCGQSADVDDCGDAGFKIRVWGPDDRTISL